MSEWACVCVCAKVPTHHIQSSLRRGTKRRRRARAYSPAYDDPNPGNNSLRPIGKKRQRPFVKMATQYVTDQQGKHNSKWWTIFELIWISLLINCVSDIILFVRVSSVFRSLCDPKFFFQGQFRDKQVRQVVCVCVRAFLHSQLNSSHRSSFLFLFCEIWFQRYPNKIN